MKSNTWWVEWPTLVLLVATYAVWGGAVFWLASWSVLLAVIVAALAIAQQSSLQHEVLHGHPLRWQWLNEAMVRPSLNLAVPYGRFRDTHLAHHRDVNLTDPYDDPESNFLAGRDWAALPSWAKLVYRMNNTLAGRMLLGPAIGQWAFMRGDIKAPSRRIVMSWLAHGITTVPVIWLVIQSPMPLWAYLVAAYTGLSLLKIRTFLEHRAHEQSRARSVIVEDRGPLAFLFLNNNLHVVHHMHPQVPWYDLPMLYRSGKDRFLACNDSYIYPSYGAIFARHLVRAKDPVEHPLLHRMLDDRMPPA
ncbi:fatty acid desaturase [Litoreibacter arenae]|uniref:Fatty acid desaturase family protein n=1 Tax=Litoreibacter arenae DSM 19593 TaxID=1123360 RepID=S9QM56_9RHOB|nr:fatty acid desaturase [Litoreibacter arenae]EPX80837.1 Fatty acid desaturase family protein [Litoreibacter arenae DSM 19593]